VSAKYVHIHLEGDPAHHYQTSPSPRLHSALLLLLLTSLLTTFPLLPLILPRLASANSALLLPLLISVTLLLSLSTAYLQSAVFALASSWGSSQVLAVMSGQGGIAVLVSGVQIILAIILALKPADAEGSQSMLAGVGIWGLTALGAFGCILAHRRLIRHPNYSVTIAPILARLERSGVEVDNKRDVGKGVSKRVFRKNWKLETAVALVFVVTLVSDSPPC